MGIKKNYVVPFTRLRCRSGRSGLVQSCYERAIRLTIHLLGASNDDFGAYDGVKFSPKYVTPRGKGMAESFSREKLRHAPHREGG